MPDQTCLRQLGAAGSLNQIELHGHQLLSELPDRCLGGIIFTDCPGVIGSQQRVFFLELFVSCLEGSNLLSQHEIPLLQRRFPFGGSSLGNVSFVGKMLYALRHRH